MSTSHARGPSLSIIAASQRRAVRTIAKVMLVIVLLSPWLTSWAPAGAQEGTPPAAATVPQTLAEAWTVPDGLPAVPSVTAKTVFVGDMDTGQVLFAQSADDHRAPASTAKILTALTVVDILPDTSETITIEKDDTVDWTVYSNAQLREGDQVTVGDLLYGLLLPSGNDAARALARVAGLKLDPQSGDPRATFVAAENDRAKALGTQNTVVKDPAGEDTDGQYTSARDLAIMGAALLDNDALAKIVSTETWDMKVSGNDVRTITVKNTNELLSEDGIIGIKTGSTSIAGACLVTGAVFSNDRVVIVVMGSDITYDNNNTVTADKRFDDTLAIIQAIVKEYTWLDLSSPTAVAGLNDELAAWQVRLGDNARIVVPTAQAAKVTYQLVLGPAGASGDEVGHVLFFLGDTRIAVQPVYQI